MNVSAVAELLRLPAVLTAPGDVLTGAAATGQLSDISRSVGLVAASGSIYLAGMALNDYADRDLDSLERPERPIPSGRVTPAAALRIAAALTAASAGLACAAEGRRALTALAPLAASVWAYDLALKNWGALPAVAAMSACRITNVVTGSGLAGARSAAPAAGVIGAHIAVTTSVSRSEAAGASARLPRAALTATAALAAATTGIAAASGSVVRTATAAVLAGGYAARVGSGYRAAVEDPSPAELQRAVGGAVIGVMGLQSSLLAATGAIVPALGLTALERVSGALARRRTVT